MTGFDVAQVYMALKAHYSPGTYDFFKYQGKVKWLTPQRFETHKDKWQFHKFSKLYPDRDTCIFFLASNFFEVGDVWIRTLFTEEAKNIYTEKLRVKESLEYLVMQDVQAMTPIFKDYLAVKNGQNPMLLNMAYRNEVLKETIVALNAAIGFLPVWEKKMTDTIVFPTFKHRCLAYEPFLQINVKSLREKLKIHLTK
jgi:hypothetical protein